MNFEQLQCVLAVAKYGSFTEAARYLPFSQSAVSKKIATLEHELGLPLFRRTTRDVGLTPAGKTFLEHGDEILRQYNLMLKKMAAHRPTERSRLVIGSIYFAPSQSIAPYVALFALNNPAVEIETVYGTTSPLIEGLLAGEIGVAIVSSMYTADEDAPPANFARDERLVSTSLSVDPYSLVVGKNHPFATRKSVSYKELKGEKLISLDKHMDVYHRALNRVFEEEGVKPNIVVTSGSVQDALLLVSQNVGVAIFSAKATSGAEEVQLVRMKRPLLRDTQIVIRREKNIPAHIGAFYKFMRSGYR